MTDQSPIIPFKQAAAHSPQSINSGGKPSPLDYRPLIEDEVSSGALTQEQADAFLRAVFIIMERFVLDGHDFAPVDKLLKGFEKAALSGDFMVNSKPPKTDNHKRGR